MRYKLVNDSVSITEPITVAEAKTHLRIDHSDDDTYIGTLITVAREVAENIAHRVIASQTFTVTYDQFLSLIRLPNSPLISVDTFNYYDTDGVQQTLSSGTGYHLSNLDFDPVLIPPDGENWPSTDTGYEKVSIAYTAGWADGSVQEPIRQAILIILGSMYCDRKDYSIAPSGLHQVPYSAKALLGRYSKTVLL